jgi:hypothetical protein
MEKGEGVRADLLYLNIHLIGHGQPYALADFNYMHAVVGFNSHKMTMTLGLEKDVTITTRGPWIFM